MDPAVSSSTITRGRECGEYSLTPPLQSGMLAVRENRYIVLAKDFEKAYKTVIKKDEQEHEFYK